MILGMPKVAQFRAKNNPSQELKIQIFSPFFAAFFREVCNSLKEIFSSSLRKASHFLDYLDHNMSNYDQQQTKYPNV